MCFSYYLINTCGFPKTFNSWTHTHTQIAICNGALQLISVPAGKTLVLMDSYGDLCLIHVDHLWRSHCDTW
jgi:hypothetical protein